MNDPFAARDALGCAAQALAAAPEAAATLQRALGSLGSLTDLLPPATLSFRLGVLSAGCAAVNPRLGEILQPVFCFCGGADLLVPSGEEGPRLGAALPNATVVVVPGASHLLLQARP